MLDIDFSKPFSTFRGAAGYNSKFNGATGMIMQEDEDYQNICAILNEYLRYNGKFDSQEELVKTLSIHGYNLSDMFPEHQTKILNKYIY